MSKTTEKEIIESVVIDLKEDIKKGHYKYIRKGVKTTVQPITKLKDIKALKKILKDNPRDYAIFILGINTALRASDIVKIKIGEVYDIDEKQINNDLVVYEKKTGKKRRITLSTDAKKGLLPLLDSKKEWDENEYLFQSRKKKSSLTPNTLSAMVKKWCAEINLKGNYASHTLRKTWGYHQRVTFNVDIPTLMQCFGHSTQKQTLEYLCIQPEEIKNVYLNGL